MCSKAKAVFMCDRDSVSRVYEAQTVQSLSELFDIAPGVIKSEDIDDRREELSAAEYVFSTWGMPALSEDVIRRYLPSLKAVFYAAGSVQQFARPFMEWGVRVFSAWGANAVPVAEYTCAQIVLAGKGYFQCVDRYRMNGREAAMEYFSALQCNYGLKIGILGAGMIGRMVLKALRAFEYESLVYDPYVSDDIITECGGVRAALQEIFESCDIISCHIANRPANVGMLGYEQFGAMKDYATFINTGRGAQVVEEGLIRALKEKPTRTALLDVTYPEPPLQGSPFLEMGNVYLTPHIAGSAGREVARMGRYMLDEAERFIKSENCLYEVTQAMLETMA